MLLTAVLVAGLASQTPDSAVRAGLVERLRAVTESLGALQAAGAHFRRDLRSASNQLVLVRAQQVRAGCVSALAAADSLAAPLSRRAYTPAGAQGDQRLLQQELAILRRSLLACRHEWDPGVARARVDSLRAWGPFRLTALDNAVRRYEQRVVRFQGHVTPPPS